MKKRVLQVCFALAILVAVAVLTLVHASAATVAQGTCGAEGDGTNLTWILDDAGTLTISGTGAMADYRWDLEAEYAPWYEWKDEILEIRLSNGITTIGNSAFSFCQNMVSVNIPDGVAKIGIDAFYKCYNFFSVYIPSSVVDLIGNDGSSPFTWCSALTEINVADDNMNYCDIDGVLLNKAQDALLCYPAGKRNTSYTVPSTVKNISKVAFCGCSNLLELVVSEGVEKIESLAVFFCHSITEIRIPKTVTKIGDSAFCRGSGLAAITVEADNPNYCSVDGVLYTKDMEKLVCYPIGKSDKIFTIPESVVEVGAEVFRGAEDIENIILPSGLKDIPYQTFLECRKLTNVKIPQGASCIGSYAFHSCHALDEIVLPESVEQIDLCAFSGSGLTKCTILSKTVELGGNVFEYCEELTIYCYAGSTAQTYAIENDIPYVLLDEDKTTDGFLYVKIYNIIVIIGYVGRGGEVTIPSEIDGIPVTSIGAFAFENCSSITKIHIPESITTIGMGAFNGCGSLTDFTVETSNPYFSVIDGVLLNKDKTDLVCYPGGRTDASYTVPESVKNIHRYAFSLNIYIVIIILPDGIAEAGAYAFYGCSGLTTLEIPRSLQTIGENAFGTCGNLIITCYKNSAVHKYLSANGIQFALQDSGTSSGNGDNKPNSGVVIQKYTVVFDTSGGGTIASLTVKKGNTAELPIPERVGYVFAGWYTDNTYTTALDPLAKITQNMTLFAKWDADIRCIIMTIDSTMASVFGKPVTNDVSPIIVNDRTMLPARFVAENLGATIAWDGAARKVTVTGNGVTIELFIDSTTAYVNGTAVTLDSPAFIHNDRTYTPVRFIAEKLGAKVEWDGVNRQVILTK